MTCCMGKENTPTPMAIATVENLRTTYRMDMVSMSWPMEVFIQENGKMEALHLNRIKTSVRPRISYN